MKCKCEKKISVHQRRWDKKVVLGEGNSFGVSRQQFGPTAREIRMSTSFLSFTFALIFILERKCNKTEEEIGSKSGWGEKENHSFQLLEEIKIGSRYLAML